MTPNVDREARTRLMEILRIFHAMRRPLSARDLSEIFNVPDATCRQYLCRLRKADCVRFAFGSARTGRYCEAVAGAAAPPDARRFRPVVRLKRAPSRPAKPAGGRLAKLARRP